jgi:hypothetical protein
MIPFVFQPIGIHLSTCTLQKSPENYEYPKRFKTLLQVLLQQLML